jgi:hypothetical protein
MVPIRQNKAVFNVDAASAFGIVIQSGASKLISDNAATDDKIRASGFKIEGMVVWMLRGAPVAITLELFEQAYDAFCPLYPFC